MRSRIKTFMGPSHMLFMWSDMSYSVNLASWNEECNNVILSFKHFEGVRRYTMGLGDIDWFGIYIFPKFQLFAVWYCCCCLSLNRPWTILFVTVSSFCFSTTFSNVFSFEKTIACNLMSICFVFTTDYRLCRGSYSVY